MKVIITGASKGIGRGIAQVLAADGMEVGLLARSTDQLKSLHAEITEAGGTSHVAPCDLRQPDRTEAAIGSLIDELGGVDALINNAGIVTRKSAWDIRLDEWHAMMETNVNGMFYATRTVLPHLKRQQSGHIINISSISGRLPLPGGSAYAASKYAVTGFSESLFQEVRDEGIKVTTIFPGSVDTNPDADSGWKVTPEEVGEACLGILKTRPENLISRVEIRPARKPAG